MGKVNQINALCHILRRTEASASEGVGVFLARNVVLTAAHVVEDAKTLRITNAKGDQTSRITDVFYGKCRDGAELDAAVILLEEAIGRSTCEVAREAPVVVGKNVPVSRLITLFNGNTSQHAVRLCTDFHSHRGNARFYSGFSIEPGYSGSPILDHRGRVISLATAMYDVPASGMSHIRGEKPFFGLKPQVLLDFLSDVQEKSAGRIELGL